jgi:tetratricopeptide (TPR) repeat protein
MFRFLGKIAAARRERDPRAQAMAALARHEFSAADEALSALLDGAEAPRERAFLLNKRGVARMGLDRREDAAADFTAAASSAGAYAPALTNLGNLLLESGDFDGAMAKYEAALAADPDYAVAHFNLGVARKRAGNIDSGVRSLRRAQRLDGTSFLRRRRRT